MTWGIPHVVYTVTDSCVGKAQLALLFVAPTKLSMTGPVNT